MNRSRLVFVLIVGAALLFVGVGVGLDRLELVSDSGTGTDDNPTDATAITLTVAASPIAVEWIESAASTFNDQRKKIDGRVVEVIVMQQDSLPVWNSPGEWSVRDHPTIWIAETAASVRYANDVGMSFAIREASLATTVMMWGMPTERAQVLVTQFGEINWTSVQQASVAAEWGAIGGQADWRFVTPGFASPDRYMSGTAALLIAAAEFHNQSDLDAGLLNDPALVDWLKPVFESVPNFASLGAFPAQVMATRGTSAADVALLPESEWLADYQSLTEKVGPLTLVYPAYQLSFEFPFAVWDGAEITETEREAADSFLEFLQSNQQRRQAATFGLRGVDGMPADTTLFDTAAIAGVSVTRPLGESIQMPSRNDLTPFVNRNWTAF